MPVDGEALKHHRDNTFDIVCWVARVGVEELVGQNVIICVETLEKLCIKVVVSMFVFQGVSQ